MFPADQDTGCSLISVHSNMKAWEEKDIGCLWLTNSAIVATASS